MADAHVGVIAGDLTGGASGTGIIENCHVGDDVTLKGNLFVGGIAGISNKGRIGGCTCAATIEGTNSSGNNAYELGGIAGQINSGTTLYNNIFTGTISGDLQEYIGAIVGNNANGDLNNLGTNVYTSTGFDGIGAAGNPTPGTNPENKAKFAYLITAGKNVTVDFNGAASADTQFGPNGISVYNKGMKYANYVVSYETSVNLLLSYKPGFIVTGYTASTGTLTGTAHTGSNDAYTLANITGPSTITAIVDLWGNLTGDANGTAEHPYILSSPEALDLLSEKVNGGTDYYGEYFKLGADIEYDPDVENNFTPIGNASNVFGGTFDGDGKTISGLNINLGTTDYVGLFGCTNASSPTTIKGVKLDNSTIKGRSYVGGILGGGSSSNTSILNCVVTSAVTVYGSVENVGGIVGKYATVRGCTSAAAVEGYQNVGGIIGNGSYSTVEYCLYTGNSVTARDPSTPKLGAIIGDKDNCSLNANYYTQATIGGSGSDGADVAGARKAVVIGAAEGVTITPTGEATTYNVSGITTYADNNVLGYDSKLYAGATDAVKLSIANTGTPETGYEFSGFTAGEGVTITSSENVYTLTVPASDVTVDVVYQAIIYNITYKGVEDEGVTFTEDNPEAYTVETESFALNNPSREGYLFTGWTYEGQDEPTKTVTIAMGSTGDKTFTANWEEFVETEVETAVTNEAAKEVEITKVMVPKGETKAVIPATVNGYTVTNIAKGAFADVTGEDHVQDIFLPDTKRLINIEEDALIFDKLMEPTLHVHLGLLSDYANMPGLKLFFEADQIQAMAVAADKFWTFSCGIDVKVPEGVKVYTCRMNDDKTAVVIHELTDDELGGVIKANNGVLLSSATGEYPFVVNHATATEVGKSYENNLLEPVLRAKNYASGEYYVLKDNEFHPILANDSKVPACKAVLHWASSAKARLEIIVGDDVKTAINGIAADEEGGEWYTVSGQRIDKPTKKGLYIKNGKKVIIK